MGRLIDTDNIPQGPYMFADGKLWISTRAIADFPTIDPVHYAGGCYCRECHRCDGFPGPDIDPGEIGICKVSGAIVMPNDFCSYGRRREDADG